MNARLSLALALAILAAPAMATGTNTFSGTYTGYAGGTVKSDSAGGSMAQSAVNGTGYAQQGSTQATGGTASVQGSYTDRGATTATNIGSYGLSSSFGTGSGNFSGNTAAGGGTDVEAHGWSGFTNQWSGGFSKGNNGNGNGGH